MVGVSEEHGVSSISRVDSSTGEILMAVSSSNDVTDSQLLPDLLEGIEGKIEQVNGDGVYDCRSNYARF
jgi:hypothetical protein